MKKSRKYAYDKYVTKHETIPYLTKLVLLNIGCNFALFVGSVATVAPSCHAKGIISSAFEEGFDPKPYERTDQGYIHDITRDKPLFCVNFITSLAVLLVSAFVAIGLSRKFHKEQAAEKSTVDFMLDIKGVKELGRKYNLTNEAFEKIIAFCPDIISKMSADERVYFDMLMDGDICINDRDVFEQMAFSIMVGYLNSHKADVAVFQSIFGLQGSKQFISNLYDKSHNIQR